MGGFAPFLSVSKARTARVAPFLSPLGGSGSILSQHFFIHRQPADGLGRSAARKMVAGRCRYYQVDDDEVPTALRLEEYDGEDDYAWLLLEAATA